MSSRHEEGTVSSPRSESLPEALLRLLGSLIDYEKDFLQTLEDLRAWLLASLAGAASPREREQELLRLQERVRELLRARGLEDGAPARGSSAGPVRPRLT